MFAEETRIFSERESRTANCSLHLLFAVYTCGMQRPSESYKMKQEYGKQQISEAGE
jgi:hypothetical protein